MLRNKKKLNAKHQSIQNIGEIIETAGNRKWKKNHKEKHNVNAKYGFYIYTANIEIKESEESADTYNVELLIHDDANGRKYLYDIQSIKRAKSLTQLLVFIKINPKRHGRRQLRPLIIIVYPIRTQKATRIFVKKAGRRERKPCRTS